MRDEWEDEAGHGYIGGGDVLVIVGVLAVGGAAVVVATYYAVWGAWLLFRIAVAAAS